MSDPNKPDAAQPDPIAAARDEFRDSGVRPAAPNTAGEQPGDVIDRYKLLQQIGEGGMGTVWMAEQHEPVRRKVALKIIKLGMDTKEVVVRFEAERQALALMDHPSIAKVLDGGVTTTGRPFFVMELVKGIPITEFCDQAKLGLLERLQLFEQTCEALQHAHHKGVVHRDVKPSNVMVTLHDGTPLPKVIDFGIAKATNAELTQKTLFTQYAHMIGTPEYMAPEQAELSALDVDTRADVYSLGVLLYELLTGTTPFDARQVLEKGYAELMRTIREDEPAKPSTRVSTLGNAGTNIAAARHVNVDRLSSRLRGDLDRIVMKAMSKDRSRRYDTATSFADDIGRFLRNEPVLAVAPSAIYRARKFVQRRRKTVIAAGLLAISLVVGAIGTTLGWYEAQRANDKLATQVIETDKERTKAVALAEKALKAERSARSEANRASKAEQLAKSETTRAIAAESASEARAQELDRVVRFLGSRLGKVDLIRMGGRIREDITKQLSPELSDELRAGLDAVNFSNTAASSLQHEVFAPTATAIEASFGNDPLIRARLLAATSIGQYDLGLHEAALANGNRSLELYTAHAGSDARRTVDMKLLVAKFLASNGKFARAEKLSREGILQTQQLPKNDDLRWQGRSILAMVLAKQGRHTDGEAECRRALEAMNAGQSADESMRLSIRQSLVSCLAAQGKFAEAEPMARQVLSDESERWGPASLKVAIAQRTLALILGQQGKTREALPLDHKVYASMRKHLGDNHTQTLSALMALGRNQLRSGSLDDAERSFTLLLERTKNSRGERANYIRAAYNGLSLVANGRGDFEEAQRLANLVKPFAENTARNEQLKLSTDLNAAIMLLNAGNSRESLKQLRALREVVLASGGRKHPLAGITACYIGTILSRQNQRGEAESMLQMAMEDCERSFGANHAQTLHAVSSMAIHLQRCSKIEPADKLFKRALAYHKRASGPSSEPYLNAQVNVATTQQQLGNLDESRTLLEQAIAGLKKLFGQDNPSTLRARARLVTLLVQIGDADEALQAGALVLDALIRVYGREHPETQNHRSTMALLAERTEDYEVALQHWRDHLEITKQQTPNDTPTVEGLMGHVLLKMHRYQEAEPLLRAGLAAKESVEQPVRMSVLSLRVQIALAAAHRGAHRDVAEWVAQASKELPSVTAKPPAMRKRDAKVTTLARIVTFYESWSAADPNGGHAEALAVARKQLATYIDQTERK